MGKISKTDKIPEFIIGVTNFIHQPELPTLKSRPAMYRMALRHLRLLPDPIIWLHVIPTMRKACSYKPPPSGQETSAPTDPGLAAQEEKKRLDSLRIAKITLNEVRAAVSCHPHALRRLIDDAYAQQGPKRYAALRSVERTSPTSTEIRINQSHLTETRPPIPKPLLPLIKPIKSAPEDKPGTQRQARIQWLRQYETVDVPLRFPNGTNVSTGLEHLGMVDTILAFARIAQEYDRYGAQDDDIGSHLSEKEKPTPVQHTQLPLPGWEQLPSFQNLPPVYQRIFPKKLKPTMREPPYPKPPRHHTRTNPHTWKNPVRLTPRFLTRNYWRFWDKLTWSRPKTADVQGDWVSCPYEEVLLWERGEFQKLNYLPPQSRNLDPRFRSRLSEASPPVTDWVQVRKQKEKSKTMVDRVMQRSKSGNKGGW